MQFKILADAVNKRFNELCSKYGNLYIVDMNKKQAWKKYLRSYPTGTDQIWRDPESTKHNCMACKHTLRQFGNIVAINGNNEIETIWKVDGVDGTYGEVASKMDKYIKTLPISGVFVEDIDYLKSLSSTKKGGKNELQYKKIKGAYRVGKKNNIVMYTKEDIMKHPTSKLFKIGDTKEYNHFYLDIPAAYIISGSMAAYNSVQVSTVQVFEKGLKLLSIDTLELALDLINQKSLINSDKFIANIERFIILKKQYNTLKTKEQRTLYCWKVGITEDTITATLANKSIGVPLKKIEEGEYPLSDIVSEYNKIADPVNYMNAVAPVTKKQLQLAEKIITEKGLMDSLERRIATMSDLPLSAINHVSNKKKTITLFDKVKPTAVSKTLDLKGVIEISYEDFLSEIVPTTTQMQVLLEHRHANKFMAITAPTVATAKNMFSWDNKFSWTFRNNLTGISAIAERVKELGGSIAAVIRGSLSWGEGRNNCDYDVHLVRPNLPKVCYEHKGTTLSDGCLLDVDVLTPSFVNYKAVENITYKTVDSMNDGKYTMCVHNYKTRDNNNGFEFELELSGEIRHYKYDKAVSDGSIIDVVSFIKEGDKFTIIDHLESTIDCKQQTIWNLDTNEFHGVRCVSYTPNHWEDNSVGNKHALFILDNVKVENSLKGFHVENLRSDLMEIRKPLGLLTKQVQIPVSDVNEPLAGIGFNTTIEDSVVIKVQGSHTRLLRVRF